MTESQYEAIAHLKAWVRDYGHLKEPAFIRDLETVLSMVETRIESCSLYVIATEKLDCEDLWNSPVITTVPFEEGAITSERLI